MLSLFFAMIGLILSALSSMVLMMIGSAVLSTIMMGVTFLFLCVVAFEFARD